MVYYEEGIFKRYEKEITDNSKKAKESGEPKKRKVIQINITGLSKSSNFEDNQKIIVMDLEEFTTLLEDYRNRESKINDLTNQMESSKLTITELEGKLDKTPETISNTNKILELVDKLDQKQTIIDNHKNIMIQANDKINTLIEEVTGNITNYFTEEISQRNADTQTKIINLLKEIKEVNRANLKLMDSIQTQVNTYNSKYESSNRFKRFFMKEININFDDLENDKQLISDFNKIDIEDTAKNITKKFTLDNNKINEIKNETKSKKIDFNKLYLNENDNPNEGDTININDTEDQDS